MSYQQAELLATVARVADASNEASGLVADDDGEFAADEIRAALCLTRRAAALLLELAWELRRLPQLGEALRSGVIDLPRARVVCAELATLDHREAHEVVIHVLERAGTETTGQLGARVRRQVLSTDPTSTKQRYERGVEGRRVELSANPDGTANLIAYSLPAERANAAYNRLHHLAHAAQGPDDPPQLGPGAGRRPHRPDRPRHRFHPPPSHRYATPLRGSETSHLCLPGCRMPATRTDLDHRVDHSKGGPTLVEYLNPLCRHDHQLKQAGWRLRPGPGGTIIWTSPLGHTYTTGPDPP